MSDSKVDHWLSKAIDFEKQENDARAAGQKVEAEAAEKKKDLAFKSAVLAENREKGGK